MVQGSPVMAQLPSPVLVVCVIIIGLVGLVLLILVFQFGWLYIQAAVSGAPVSFLRLVAMKLRRINASIVVNAYIAAQKAKFDIPLDDLEIHSMAGGDVSRVVNALIAADASGAKLSYDRACAIDLAGRNVFDETQSWVNPPVLSCPSPAMGRDFVRGIALDGIELKASARITVRTNFERLVGGAGKETIVARVAEGIVRRIGDSVSHKEILEDPNVLVEHLFEQNLDAGAGYEILAIEITSISVGENVGARLQAEQLESDRRVEDARKNRNMD